MIAYLALGFVALIGIIYAMRLVASADPAVLARVLRWIGIGVVAGGLLLMVFRGQLGVVMTLAGLVLLLLRWRNSWRYAGRAQPAGGQVSRIDTAWLAMTLDHDSGQLEGKVRAGRHQGRRLSELPLEALLELRAECATADPESLPLLEAYLDRVHGAAWRGEADAASAADGAGAHTAAAGAPMTREEAYQILGLEAGAGAAEIRDAYHRLMKRFHPDQGGSNYLAARINQAKDLLLGES